MLIKTRMSHLKLTQKDLAVKSGLKSNNFQQVSNISRGVCGFPPKHIKSFAVALQLDAQDIINAMAEDYKIALKKVINENNNTNN